jgi:hypothetical protein
MKPKIDRMESAGGSVSYDVSFGPCYIGTFSSAAQAAAAIKGAEAVHFAQRRLKAEDKQGREISRVYSDATHKVKGLRIIAGKWCVTSPRYLGSFDTLELAQAARDAALAANKANRRKYK